jgi:acyl-CoA thioesterase-1
VFRRFILTFCVLAAGSAGCTRTNPANRARPSQTLPPPTPPDGRIDRSGWPVIVAFGDSLTAGAGVPAPINYPSQLQAALDARGFKYRVVNAGVSGEISGEGRARVSAVLAHQPRIVILELGVNDGLRGYPLDQVRRNLAGIIEHLQAAGVQVLLAGMQVAPVLAGMRVPPVRMTSDYVDEFRKIFPDLASRYQLPLIPFFLEDVALVRELNQEDGLHPTAEGYSYVVRNVLAVLEPLLEKEK